MDEAHKKDNTKDLINQLMSYESGEMSDEEEIKFFQELIDTRLVWSLQGHYGRVAATLIEAGLCRKNNA